MHQVIQGVFEHVVVDVLLQEVLVVELFLEHGLLIELAEGELLGGLEIGLTLGEVGLGGRSQLSLTVIGHASLLRAPGRSPGPGQGRRPTVLLSICPAPAIAQDPFSAVPARAASWSEWPNLN